MKIFKKENSKPLKSSKKKTLNLLLTRVMQEAGCSRIIGVDTNPAKERRARDMGMTDFVNPADIKVGVVVGMVVVEVEVEVVVELVVAASW